MTSQMSAHPERLLTIDEYETALAQLRERFSWVGESILRPPPGYLSFIADFLQDVEEIAGREGLEERLEFLRTDTDHDFNLSLFVSISCECDAKTSALSHSLHQARTRAAGHCAACTAKLDSIFRTRRLCTDHQHLESSLFAGEEEVQEPGDEEDWDTGCGAKRIFPPQNPMQEAEIETRPPPEELNAATAAEADLTPRVRVFDPEKIAKIEAGSKRNADSDHQRRLQDLARRLRATEAEKPLALIPRYLEALTEKLAADFPNFTEVVEFLADQFSLGCLGDRRLALPPLLFHGPPGIGKTELALSLADMLAVDALVLDLSSAQTGASLSGSDAYWSNTQPGQLFETLAFGAAANPIVILEEIDKATTDSRYSTINPLHALLEEKTARRFTDLSVKDLELDASHVVWFATANELSAIPSQIRSRFTVFSVAAPTQEQSRRIARSIYRRLLANFSWGSCFKEDLSDDVAMKLSAFPPREMKSKLLRACGRAARQQRNYLTLEDIGCLVQAATAGIGFLASIA